MHISLILSSLLLFLAGLPVTIAAVSVAILDEVTILRGAFVAGNFSGVDD